MKVLFVLFDYSPFGGATARIVTGLIEKFQASGVVSDVLTSKYDFTQPFEQQEELGTVYRVKNYQRVNFRQLSCGPIRKGIVAFGKIRDKISLKNPKHFLSRLTINDFVRGLKKIDLKIYRYIIPVCADYAVYAALEKYRKKYGLDNNVIVYQLDPLSENGVYTTQSFSSRLEMEKRMANETAVITTEILKKQKEKNGIDVSNVIPLEFPSIAEQPASINPRTDEIKVVFAGFFYKDIRDPEYALRLFTKIKNPKVRLYIIGGGLEDLVDRYITESCGRIIRLGVLSLEETQRKIAEADILLNIGNNNINFVPSKIFDYISTGKPIVNTYKDTACPTLPYFAKYSNAISIYEKDPIEKEAERLERFIENNYNKTIPYAVIEKIFHKNTLNFVAEEFVATLKNPTARTYEASGGKNGTI